MQKHLNENITTTKTLFIPKGSTKSVLSHLDKNGIKMQFFDYYLIKLYGFPQAGWIDIGAKTLTRDEFYKRLTSSKAAVKNVTLIPGETKEIFFQKLSTKFDFNTTKLFASYDKFAPYPDGVIVAETYSVPVGIDEDELIKHLVNNSLTLHKKLSKKLLNKYDEKEWFERYITVASIIIKESAGVEEMPLVSAVIYNRLKINQPLQMDGTLNYKYQSNTKVTPKMIREDLSPFNTYKNQGLPPHPICAVTNESISASINPADVNYLYFMRNINGKHDFTNSYKKHLLNIKKLKSVKKWNTWIFIVLQKVTFDTFLEKIYNLEVKISITTILKNKRGKKCQQLYGLK